MDYEVELAFIISKSGRHIAESEAMSHVAGYTVAHDVTARDWQMKKNGKQWLLGKTFDTFCPLGPALITPCSLSGLLQYMDAHTSSLPDCLFDNFADPHKLGIRCRLNGETVQDSNTDKLMFKTEALIAFISKSGYIHTLYMYTLGMGLCMCVQVCDSSTR